MAVQSFKREMKITFDVHTHLSNLTFSGLATSRPFLILGMLLRLLWNWLIRCSAVKYYKQFQKITCCFKKFHFSDIHRRWTQRVALTWYMTHCVNTSMNVIKMKFVSYIYTLLTKKKDKLTCLVITFNRHPNVTSANQLFHLSVMLLMHNVTWTTVFHWCMKLVGPCRVI